MDLSLLFCGFVFGVIGVYLFKQGKQRGNIPWILIAIAMFIFPYFIENIWLSWIIGIGLCFTAYLRRF